MLVYLSFYMCNLICFTGFCHIRESGLTSKPASFYLKKEVKTWLLASLLDPLFYTMLMCLILLILGGTRSFCLQRFGKGVQILYPLWSLETCLILPKQK